MSFYFIKINNILFIKSASFSQFLVLILRFLRESDSDNLEFGSEVSKI